MSRVYAVRGATTVTDDTREQVVQATQELLRQLLDRNALDPGDLVSILFTATDDIRTEFPAAAARLMGLDVPLLCARELDVSSSLAVSRCIRVLVHCYSGERPSPVYLNEASRLLDPPDPA